MKLSQIDPKKCPILYAVIGRELAARNGGWPRVVELRASGDLDGAERFARKLLGVQGPPMSEETKEKLRRYNEEHRDEIRTHAKQKREVRRRTVEMLKSRRRNR